MDIEALINAKLQKLQDFNKQIGQISQQIGTLQEQGRALHGAALELKGAIEGLAELKDNEDKKLAASQTAKLTLPTGVKPVVPESAPVVVPASEVPEHVKAAVAAEATKAATVLEVK